MDLVIPSISMMLGAALCGFVLLQAVIWLGRLWMGAARRERQHRERREAFQTKVQTTLRRERARHSHAAWEGWRPFRVAAIVDEAVDVKSFYLAPVDGLSLPGFEPGQFLTFRLQPPGSQQAIVRCYSLSDRPRPDYYRCTIKRLSAPAGHPDLPAGRVSTYMFNDARVGDLVDLQAPRGTFFLEPESIQPIVLVGGGIGVTPLVSMLIAMAEHNDSREVYFLYGVKDGEHHPFKDYLATLVASRDSFHAYVNYSSPRKTDRLGMDYHSAGRISIERIRELLPSSNFQFYVCGPSDMMNTIVPALLDWGVPAEDIRYEAFGPASVKATIKQPPIQRQLDTPCEVSFARHGCSLLWEASFTSLLEFAEANGVPLESGCRAGNCGQCLTPIKSGSVTTLKQPGVPVEQGHCLTCVSVPAEPLVLDT